MKYAILILALLLPACSDDPRPQDMAPHKQRTEGWMQGEWHETESRVVGDVIYTKYENATEIRWFELKNLRSRPMGREERVPQ